MFYRNFFFHQHLRLFRVNGKRSKSHVFSRLTASLDESREVTCGRGGGWGRERRRDSESRGKKGRTFFFRPSPADCLTTDFFRFVY